MTDAPEITPAIAAIPKGGSKLIVNAKVSSVSSVASRLGKTFKPARRFITRQESADVRVWRLE